MRESRSSRLGLAFFLAWPFVPVVVSYYGVTRYGIDERGGPPRASAAPSTAGGEPVAAGAAGCAAAPPTATAGAHLRRAR
jgi:hypothetical protein